ncbi:MAG: hypothetical protein AAFY81_04305, partial [Pseudomonadota bacterium]
MKTLPIMLRTLLTPAAAFLAITAPLGALAQDGEAASGDTAEETAEEGAVEEERPAKPTFFPQIDYDPNSD